MNTLKAEQNQTAPMSAGLLMASATAPAVMPSDGEKKPRFNFPRVKLSDLSSVPTATAVVPIADAASASPDIPFWRKVTDEDVWAAIDGSFLGTICGTLSKSFKPYAPLSLILLHGIVLMGCALTRKRDEDNDEEKGAFDYLLDDAHFAPALKSRVYINTGTGNVPNIFALLVAPSGAGKGLGYPNLLKTIGYEVVSSGSSLEGVKDVAMVNPHVLISIQEFSSILTQKGYKSDFKNGLTDFFNGGYFSDVLSSRKRCVLRSVDWFYPSVTASVQPEVLKKYGNEIDIAQGFLSRFLVGYANKKDYDFNPCNPDCISDLQRLRIGLIRIALFKGVIEVPNPNYNTDFSRPIRELISEKMYPVLDRYANEYLPRIATMLAIPGNIHETTGQPELPKLTNDHLQRATVVLHRILAWAEQAYGALSDLEGYSRQHEENMGKMARLLSRLSDKNPKISITDISRNSSGSGWDAKMRDNLLNEALQRGWIDVSHPTIEGIDKVVKGCTITFNKDQLPPGVL